MPESSSIQRVAMLVGAAAMVLLVCVCNMDRLGDIFMKDNEYVVAMPCYQVMTNTQTVLGSKSQRLADAWTNLGVCYAKMNRDDEALKAQHLAVEMRKAILNTDTRLSLGHL